MTFLSHHTLRFTPLSPVHIGADESYEPGNYVIDDSENALYSFDSQAAINSLEESDRQQLLRIVSGKPDQKMLTDVQAFFNKRRELLIGSAHLPILTADGIAELYRKRIGQTAQHEGQGRRVINKLEIERTAYNPANNQPILPGSSIKGAIRTALLDNENNNSQTAFKGEKNQKMQERLFEGKFATDPMRLISIGDAFWQGDAQMPDRQIVFAVNRKREQVLKDGKEILSQAERSNLYQLLESLIVTDAADFKGSLQIQRMQDLRQDDRKMPKADKQWQIKEIAEACNRFYFPLLRQEIEQMQFRNLLCHSWIDQIENRLEQGLLKRMEKREAFLLRVGRHSGAEGLTLNGVRKIKIKGKGREFTTENKPKTWWLAASNEKQTAAMQPFGWILVDIDPPEKIVSTAANSELANWYQKQQAKQNALKDQARQRMALVEKRKQQAEQEAKLAQQKQAEQERQDQLEQQRIATLPPIEQDMIRLIKNKVDANKKDYLVLLDAVENHTEWSDDDKKIVLQRIKEIMQSANDWRETSQKKKPEKDKPYQLTLKVKAMIEGL